MRDRQFIEVLTGEYQFVHGRKPRGTGQWGFNFDQNDDIRRVFWYNGPFAEAKRAAIKQARQLGHTVVRVAS